MFNRKLAALMLVPSALAVPALGIAAPAGATTGDAQKVWVCKYVHAPGTETEVLKPGKQPIAVSSAATVGDAFNDGQVLSLVVDVVTEENTSLKGRRYTGAVGCPAEIETPVDPGEEPTAT